MRPVPLLAQDGSNDACAVPILPHQRDAALLNKQLLRIQTIADEDDDRLLMVQGNRVECFLDGAKVTSPANRHNEICCLARPGREVLSEEDKQKAIDTDRVTPHEFLTALA
jgi:hypothetical protein